MAKFGQGKVYLGRGLDATDVNGVEGSSEAKALQRVARQRLCPDWRCSARQRQGGARYGSARTSRGVEKHGVAMA